MRLGCLRPVQGSAWEPGIVEGFKDHGISWDVQTFDGAPSYEAARGVADLAAVSEPEGAEKCTGLIVRRLKTRRRPLSCSWLVFFLHSLPCLPA